MAKNDKHTRGSTSPKAGEEYRLDFSFCDTHRATQTLWGTIKAAKNRAHPEMKKKKKKELVTSIVSKGKPAVESTSLDSFLLV